MIKYNDDNIYVGYIKQLLHTFNLPTCRVYKSYYKFAKNEKFIYKDAIYISSDFGYINEDSIQDTLEKVCDYKVGDKILNITKTLEIRNNYYDAYTHEYLGEYLRFIRDYYNLDLMSMYNCFSNKSPSHLDIMLAKDNSAIDYYSITTKDLDYNIYMVSVKPNTTYTIAIEYPFTFQMFCGFYSYNKYLDLNDEDVTTKDFSSLERSSFKFIRPQRFSKPFTYTTPELTNDNQINQEDNMKLFIILPASFINNIVILEGDYTLSTELHLDGFKQIICKELLDYSIDKDVYGDVDLNYKYITKKQLLQFSTTTKYLLADRLIEYLSNNAITQIDSVVDNIKKVQLYLASQVDDQRFKNNIYGEWNDNMRKWIYSYIVSTNEKGKPITYVDDLNDLLGYVDKDVESMLRTFEVKKEAIKSKLEELGGL